jgi:hypothetical protein
MAIKHIIVLFVETPRKFIYLCGVSTNKTIIYYVTYRAQRHGVRSKGRRSACVFQADAHPLHRSFL